MPLRIASVTAPPAIIAPLTSKLAATASACFMVKVPASAALPMPRHRKNMAEK